MPTEKKAPPWEWACDDNGWALGAFDSNGEGEEIAVIPVDGRTSDERAEEIYSYILQANAAGEAIELLRRMLQTFDETEDSFAAFHCIAPQARKLLNHVPEPDDAQDE